MRALSGLLLAGAVLTLGISGVALLAVRDGRDRIHFAGPATTLAPLLVAAALAAGGGGATIVAKALLLVLVLAAGSAIVSHALLGAQGPRGPRGGR